MKNKSDYIVYLNVYRHYKYYCKFDGEEFQNILRGTDCICYLLVKNTHYPITSNDRRKLCDTYRLRLLLQSGKYELFSI